MLTLYEQYKEACPYSQVKEGDISPAAMRDAIAVYSRNRAQAAANKKRPPTAKEKAAYERWKANRKFTDWVSLPDVVKTEIRLAVEAYQAEVAPIEQLYLVGSYAAGSWIDSNSTAADLKIRKPYKSIRRLSDVDLYPVPFTRGFARGMVEFTGAARGTKVLIFEEGKFIGEDG